MTSFPNQPTALANPYLDQGPVDLPWRLTRTLWAGLFVLLTVFTGTTREACLGSSRVMNQVVTIALVLGCLVIRDNRGRLLLQFRAAWTRLPVWALLLPVAWLGCLAWSTQRSTLPVLSMEVGGFMAWNLLLCALVFGYAAGGAGRLRHALAGVLVSLDICLAFGAAQFVGYWSNPRRDPSYQAQHNAVVSLLNDTNHFGLYLAALLPLALWDAGRAAASAAQEPPADTSFDLARPARQLWSLWRALRPGIMLALGVATTSRSNWAAVVAGVALLLWLQRRTLNTGEFKAALKAFAPGFAVGLVLSLAIALLESDWIRFHMGQTVQAGAMTSMGRGMIWHNELRMFHARPLTGWGPGTFAINYPQFFLPTQFREPVLEGHNLYLHRLAEEGAPAALCWLAFVAGIWSAGLKRALSRLDIDTPKQSLLAALASSLFAYAVCAIFVMPEQTPTITVTFYTLLAAVAALVWGDPLGASHRHLERIEKIAIEDTIGASLPSPHSGRGAGGEGSGAGTLNPHTLLVTIIMIIALLAATVQAPSTLKSDTAQLAFDTAIDAKTPSERIALLRDALRDDPAQPEYWAQLGWAEAALSGPVGSTEGAGGSVAIGDYQAALRRYPNDAVFWHNLAQLSFRTGNLESAARCERSAIANDPTFYLYHQALAAIYANSGNPAGARAESALATTYTLPPLASAGIPPKPGECQLPWRYRRIIKPVELFH